MTERIDTDTCLKRVRWSAAACGPVLRYSSVQSYENAGEDDVEISYTFPQPRGKSVILKFAAVVNGVRREARAMPKRQAEERYEEAVGEGDSPVMLEIEDGLCTASLGNLRPGEKAEVELAYALLLEPALGTARITVPTVIDQYYAADPCSAPQGRQAVVTSALARYDLEGELVLGGELADCRVSSPVNKLVAQRTADGLKVTLAPGSSMDRDLVIDIEGMPAASSALAADGERWACIASFCPPEPEGRREQPLSCGLLVDCSGSMGGDRIRSARLALMKLVGQRRPGDRLGLYRFGSGWEEAVSFGEADAGQAARLNAALQRCEADMGGTEMQSAIHRTGEACRKAMRGRAGDILLITDGDVWDKDACVSAARGTGRRLFALGVGMAPGHCVLEEIAEATGGAYEAVYDDGGVEAAVLRMA
ncbi:MAG: VWA domain-containing protein, partial [Duodenibacillus sp.]|nr:VWA domain-containing protein [Duodenibacillus sp.]